ncbi:hypothetical protein QBC38DRAFT_503771, partial [Podospora fimiseda]
MSVRVQGCKSDDKSLIQETCYCPALDRARGSQLEARMRIPPASTVFLTYDLECRPTRSSATTSHLPHHRE